MPRTMIIWFAAVAALASCTDPIVLDWRYESEWGSVSTPLVTDEYIAFGGEGGLTILEPSGALRCVFDSHGEVISAPATDGERIYFGSVSYLFYAIKPDCNLAWKFTTGDRIKSDPLVQAGVVYTSSYDGHVYALKASSGERIWVFPSPGVPTIEEKPEEGKVAPSKGGGRGKRIAKGPRAGRRGGKKGRRKAARDKAAATAASEEAPQEVAAASAPPPQPTEVGDFSYSSPVLHEGVLYVGNFDHHLYALDAATGKMLWRFRTAAPITSTALVHGGVLYFGSNDGGVYAVDITTQKARWRVRTQDWVNSSTRIIDDTLYVGGNDRHVYAIDYVKGEVRWKYETEGPVIGTPAIYKNLIFAVGSSGDGAIYAIDRTSQALFWSYKTQGKIDSDPVIVGNRIFVTCSDRSLYVFKITTTQAS